MSSSALSFAPPNDAYLRLDAEGVEKPVDNGEEKTEQIGVTVNKRQDHNFDQHRPCSRVTHVETKSIVKSTLTVEEEFPPDLGHGAFSQLRARIESQRVV